MSVLSADVSSLSASRCGLVYVDSGEISPAVGHAMKVTFVTMNYAPSVGGAQALVREIAEGLAQVHGHEVEVLTTNAVKAPAARHAGKVMGGRRAVLGGVTIRRYPYARRLHALHRSWRRFRRQVRAQRPTDRSGPVQVGPLGLRLQLAAMWSTMTSDVVVVCPAPSLTMVNVGWSPFRRAGRVLIPLLHRREDEPRVLRGASALRRFDAVVALTDFERTWMVELGVAGSTVHVVPPGCHPDRYPQMTPSLARQKAGLPDRTTIGYVGRLAAHKGIDSILAAAPRLFRIHPELTVLLAGAAHGWPGFESLRARAAAIAGDRLVIREDFSDDERSLLLAACDVVLTPSRGESFGMVNVEAWAASRPVVAGDIPAVCSLVHHGSDGLLVAPGNPDDLAEATLALLQDAELAGRMGRAGRARAVEEFDWDAIVHRWDELVRDVACHADTPR